MISPLVGFVFLHFRFFSFVESQWLKLRQQSFLFVNPAVVNGTTIILKAWSLLFSSAIESKRFFFLFTTLTVEKPERGLKNNMKRGWMKSFRTLIYIYFKCFFFSVLFIFYIFFKRPLLFIFIIRPVKMTRPVCFGPMSCLTL